MENKIKQINFLFILVWYKNCINHMNDSIKHRNVGFCHVGVVYKNAWKNVQYN
jgi:hypothetical protein